MNNTVNYYNQNAIEYFNRTFPFNNSFNQWKFVNEVIAGAYESPKMLDIGCGSCRDTVFFKNRGIDVLPIDASKELATIVKEKLGIDVLVMDMTEISFVEEFDFIEKLSKNTPTS
jgi:SAM-dependent methyltransferase